MFEDLRICPRMAINPDCKIKSGNEAKVIDMLTRLQVKYIEFISQRGSPAIKRGTLRLRFLSRSLQKIADRTIGRGVATVLIREGIRL